MELALYAPALGYYSAGATKFGAQGDFVTAPEISPLFGRALARQVAQVLGAAGGGVLELGAGSGKLAVDVIGELSRLQALPDEYLILEVSAELAQRQRREIAERLPDLAGQVRWIADLPASFTGAVLANEVLDVMPAHVVTWQANGVRERGVAVENGEFVWRERPLTAGPLLEAARKIAVPPGYTSEVNLIARAFVRSLGACLVRGVALFIDYGFPAREYYHPQRHMGTLMCHHRHHAHPDPFYLPGLQDITAHVDFTAMGRAAGEANMDVLGYTRQANFLIDCGILELLAETAPSEPARYLPLANQTQRLLSPNEMGELFKVLAIGRDVEVPLIGFRSGSGQL